MPIVNFIHLQRKSRMTISRDINISYVTKTTSYIDLLKMTWTYCPYGTRIMTGECPTGDECLVVNCSTDYSSLPWIWGNAWFQNPSGGRACRQWRCSSPRWAGGRVACITHQWHKTWKKKYADGLPCPTTGGWLKLVEKWHHLLARKTNCCGGKSLDSHCGGQWALGSCFVRSAWSRTLHIMREPGGYVLRKAAGR